MTDELSKAEIATGRPEPAGSRSRAARPRAEWTPLRRRACALVAFLAFSALAYLLVLLTFDLEQRASERVFTSGPEGAQRVKIYVEPLSVDPISQAVQIRIDMTPSGTLLGRRPDAPSRDLMVVLSHSDIAEVLAFRAEQPVAPATIRASLAEGSIAQYPFDRYQVDLRIQSLEGAAASPDGQKAMSQEVTVWQGAVGYQVRAAAISDGATDAIGLRIDIRRTGAHIFFALAAYAAMVVLAGCSLIISCSVFLGRRKMEAALVGALAALVFALPALRSAMPGAPPLGVGADLAVFLWTELAVVFGVALLVASWAGLAAKT